ncbi:ISXO2-like transposase domain-containing protein [Roseovarius nanhaiticus]|uniref:ISXO2-like transposase domain-containing protein n=2 Tax=Roseovarius nanhaiticus TaxID=573024 RepID=A0A1N7HP39_9RHOB|nr:IS1595 family transposase [Roseovarius nanhaiticus]SEK26181.1 ISXO2-like transposase domain-containing protein [Roseovarius nanhaiticus]SEK91172.1 ISXO2-like transposase domain-containing protein [Roseovarius nanhaiticus]SEL38053.1 ISXO2-like transposase domain-containing protein [Roseovarius nanhaiticus]SIS26586.1 ISXO2-like transposase domain-containing protein [Roseovarius nanhaiticus]
MRHHDFRRFLDRISLLSPAQIAEAGTAFQDVRRRSEALTEIEERTKKEHKCPFCECEARQKCGTTKTKVQRYRCSDCLKTYSGRTTSIIRYIHRPDLFLEVLRDMMGDAPPSPVRRLANDLDLNKYTIWRWRMIILDGLSGSSSKAFAGIVEADETFQRESRKGSREWGNHLRDPAHHSAPPRLRWYEYGRKGVPMMRGLSRWQLPILTLVDRNGARRAERIPNRTDKTIEAALAPFVAPDVVLCADGLSGYKNFTASRQITHVEIKPIKASIGGSSAYHIQNANSLHQLYKTFIRPFRGPASKYLDGYIFWFIARSLKWDPVEVFRAI